MEKIEIGKIVKEQGIKGDVKIILFADADFDFSLLKKVYINGQEAHIQKTYAVSGGIGVKFDIIDSRNSAGNYKNALIYSDKNDILCKKNRYFIADLLNKMVQTNNGDQLGKLVDIQNFGSADVLYISGDKQILVSHVDGLIENVDDAKIVLDEQKFRQVAVYED